MLLWQVDVTINPHDFVIATCIWSVQIIYLLVSCNKQFFSLRCGARYSSYFDTSRSSRSLFCTLSVETKTKSGSASQREKLLITTYQEVNDLYWSNTCCDDEIVRVDGNIDLPEQHFLNKPNEKLRLPVDTYVSFCLYSMVIS